jgi:tRNA G18 (ribose-2'-O)-methylase SpoU
MRKLKHHEIPRPDPSAAVTLPKHPISVVLDNVRSLYNVGSIFRTSDAAGVEHLYLTGITGTPENPALHKTALGAQDTVAWTYEKSASTVLNKLRADGYTLAVLEITDSPTDVSALEATHFPLCLIVGNEVSGVSDDLVSMADLAIEIPQFGAKHSLNVAVAYGVALFDLIRVYERVSEGVRR